MATTINASNTTGGAVVTGDGSGVLELQSGGVTGITVNGPNVTVAGTLTATGGLSALTTPVIVTGSSTAGAEIRLPEDTDNGSNYVAIKAPNALAANVTFTLPTADGTNGQYLRTDGAGNLSFATVPVTSPAGTTGQVQINNAGAFGAVASGTSGQVLTSNGAGVAPSFATPNPVPGAFGQFSVSGALQSNVQNVAASAASMASAGGWSSVATQSYTTSAGAWGTIRSIVYSTYYGCWFGLGSEQAVGSLQNGVWSSIDGLNWNLVVSAIRTKMGVSASWSVQRICVDDSDGRLFVGAADNSVGTMSIYTSSGTNWNSYTNISIASPGVSNCEFIELFYIDTGSISTSGMVTTFTDGGTTYYLRTCPPGGTTFTNRITNAAAGSSITYNRTSGFAVVATTGQTNVLIMTGNNAQTGWSTVALGATVNGWNVSAVNSSAIIVGTGSDLPRISTNGTTFTSGTAVSGGSNLYSLFHNGSVWVASTANGTYTNSSATGTGSWTLVNGVVPLILEQRRARQRYI